MPAMRRCLALAFVLTGWIALHAGASGVRALDAAGIRGANYCPAGGHHVEHWRNYNPQENERDLDYARKIGLNQVRVFLSYSVYLENKETFRRNLQHLARACAARGIGLLPVVAYKAEMIHEAAPYPLTRAWAQDLIDTIGGEPALACWDVFNEPDYPPKNPQRAEVMAYARTIAQIFRELDPHQPRTPVTIGYAFEKPMEENADVVDVLSFHDYSPTRQQIRDQIAAAFACAARVNKPVINTEIGCTGRANPYDVAIEEFSRAHMGFYIWELMITKYWGDVHGVFYPDGTIRDPAIPAALLGLYRNRRPDAVPENPDREGWVTRTLAQGRTWLADANAPYAEGLRVAEIAANILEANELVPMRDLPSRRVALLRVGPPDPAALRSLVAGLLDQLEPFKKPETK
ncbi:MAG TPA: cellulase family glycosylhydrolase [Lacunisphaera sp.]|nr:cellulase family glycosylhydrolase [Lacunisphaera sp.]